MKRLLFLFILITTVTHSQSDRYKLILQEGNDAYLTENFQLAREKYWAAYQIDSTESDALFNLAAIELRFSNMAKACELLQKSYKLKDIDAGKLIKEHCGKIEYNQNMFIDDVDTMPKFKLGNKEPYVVTKTGLNPILLKRFSKLIKKSSLYKDLKGGKIFVIFTIDHQGNFNSRVTGKNSSKQLDLEVNRIFNSIAEYIPCQYEGKNVGMWNGYSLPINF